jgi:hypothetical protein
MQLREIIKIPLSFISLFVYVILSDLQLTEKRAVKKKQ